MLKRGRHTVDEVIVHQTTTRPDWMADQSAEAKVKEIDRWHRNNGWQNGFGYHYLIDRDGTVVPGRPESMIGAHVGGRNSTTIGVTLVGGFGANKRDQFSRHFTPQQNVALRELLDDFDVRLGITEVNGHDKYANKACPGFGVKRWLDAGTKPPREHVAQSTTVQVSGAQVLSGATGFLAALSGLSGNAQIFALVACTLLMASGAYIMRERIGHWFESGVQ